MYFNLDCKHNPSFLEPGDLVTLVPYKFYGKAQQGVVLLRTTAFVIGLISSQGLIAQHQSQLHGIRDGYVDLLGKVDRTVISFVIETIVKWLGEKL